MVRVRARFSAAARCGASRAATSRPAAPAAGECGQPPCAASGERGSLWGSHADAPHRFAARFLPKGWRDLLRQILLFCGAYWLYRLVRGITDGQVAEAFDNARELIGLERGLGLFIEPAVHAWAEGTRWLIDGASWMYVNSHFTITTVTLAFIYLRRNPSFYFIRNMFMVAMGIALVLYAAYPTAPPRFMPEWGFTDSVARFTGLTAEGSSADALYNPFAAVPSMHVAFALMLGAADGDMARRALGQGALAAPIPLLVTFVVVATANHWWFDAFTGALVAAVAALAAAAVRALAPGRVGVDAAGARPPPGRPSRIRPVHALPAARTRAPPDGARVPGARAQPARSSRA